jgi:archaellum biogenesis ATPase FlaH
MELKPNFNLERFSPVTPEAIISEAEQLVKQANEEQEQKGLFLAKTANNWIKQAKTRPIPKMLFSEFWFEGELCILFADTNLGKSILAVQIGNSISKGEEIKGFTLETTEQPVLYFDFELSDKQFENRYSIKFEQHYNFAEYFIRIEINPDAEIPQNQSFEDFLNYSLERCIKETGAKVLIIDNLTYLKNETEKAKDALPLMKHLKALKSRYGLSILALAHTPKRDLTKPITRNDLQGSKMLINFCDSAFTIGESQADKSFRYIKQIKQRNTEQLYDAENVIVCQIHKPLNFLEFEFVNFGKEWEHLKQITETEKSDIENSIKELREAEPTLSAYAIAQRLCKDESKFASFKVKVYRVLNKIGNT